MPAIIDDIYDLERVPKDDLHFVHGTNYYTYCKVKEIIDAHARRSPPQRGDELSRRGFRRVVPVRRRRQLDRDRDRGITPYTGATYTPNAAVGAGIVGASLLLEAVKLLSASSRRPPGTAPSLGRRTTRTACAASSTAQGGRHRGALDGASGFNDVNWISDLIDAATAERTPSPPTSARARR